MEDKISNVLDGLSLDPNTDEADSDAALQVALAESLSTAPAASTHAQSSPQDLPHNEPTTNSNGDTKPVSNHHPSQQMQAAAAPFIPGPRPCRYDVDCRRIECPFPHPNGRLMDKAPHMGKVVPSISWDRAFVQTVSSAGLIAYADGPKVDESTKKPIRYACLVVERRFEQGVSRTVISLPGGMWDRKHDSNPHDCAVREFHEETRGIFQSQDARIHKSLVKDFPKNTTYSADGKYLICAARVKYIDEIGSHFKEGVRVDDSTITVVWVPIRDMIEKKINVEIMSGKLFKQKTSVPVSEFLAKLLHFSLLQEMLQWIDQ